MADKGSAQRGTEGRGEARGPCTPLLYPHSPSDSESKTSIVKVIRSILRENFRRHIKCELPLEKACKDRLVPLKNRVPVSAKLGENFGSSVHPRHSGQGHALVVQLWVTLSGLRESFTALRHPT